MNDPQEMLGPKLASIRQHAVAFLHEINGVSAVVVATIDGFELASAIRDNDDAGRIAAMGSSISALSSVVASETGLGAYKSVTINTEAGFAVVQGAPCGDIPMVLNVIANSDAILAQVLHRAASVAKALCE